MARARRSPPRSRGATCAWPWRNLAVLPHASCPSAGARRAHPETGPAPWQEASFAIAATTGPRKLIDKAEGIEAFSARQPINPNPRCRSVRHSSGSGTRCWGRTEKCCMLRKTSDAYSRIWRKGWDSNPRWSCPHGGFQDRCLKPLGHPSGTCEAGEGRPVGGEGPCGSLATIPARGPHLWLAAGERQPSRWGAARGAPMPPWRMRPRVVGQTASITS